MKKLFIFFAICILPLVADARGIQAAWDHPEANMAAGSTKPGFAQLTWTPGAVLPIKLRNGMVTMVNFPAGEVIEDGQIGNTGLFEFEIQRSTIFISPMPANQGSDTNLIITGKSGNVYILYLRSEPANASEITYSQVDIVLDGGRVLPGGNGAANAPASGGMNSIFNRNRPAAGSGMIGVDGEDYGWIKSMKIDPSEFRFDLDIFVPNPDDYVIAPERVWRDRIFTYIDFGDKVIAMTQRPVVSLLIEGGESPVGFRTDGENGRLLIVEAVGDMVLRSGQRLVCIKKRGKPFLIADTASVMALAEANVAASWMSNQSLNNVVFGDTPMMPMQQQMQPMMFDQGGGGFGFQPMPGAMPLNQGAPSMRSFSGANMIPSERITAGSFLPQSGIPLITSNQRGVAVELRSDTSVKALNDYWTNLLARFSGDEGAGLLTPYKDKVFFAVDEQGVGTLGGGGSTARLYRLRVGPMSDIDEAQTLCNQLQRFQSVACHVVRIQ
ncbi:MAG: TrbG/VirB9 family P-type conjugative transfer protein [Alphaproteobacteria bacterium]|nr:TrbG/VirB9 family P-type conjugative transfer protein [Alphaproteobacteria bacterium]MCL2890042.1 TrbG/VirB9 family P-type conjugative transfer protein [Alphaproteobacteria bacterium]